MQVQETDPKTGELILEYLQQQDYNVKAEKREVRQDYYDAMNNPQRVAAQAEKAGFRRKITMNKSPNYKV